jgi:AcrR family transcriptional regulator
VADVVRCAGVSRRTFYELFADRDDCLLAALDQAIAAVSERVLDAYDGGPETATRQHERIRAGLLALLKFLDEEPLMGHLLIVESLKAGSRALERRAQVLAAATRAFEELCRTARQAGATELLPEGTVGAVLSVIHGRILDCDAGPLVALANPLMSMIVLPYLGTGAARRELRREVPVSERRSASTPDTLKAIGIRVTYRTMQVMRAIDEQPGISNRQVGLAAGIEDQGQVSKLLARLAHRGLIENTSHGNARGSRNEWRLTARGEQVHLALGARCGGPARLVGHPPRPDSPAPQARQVRLGTLPCGGAA